MSISTTKTFGRITQLSLHGKIIHVSLQKKRKHLDIGVNAVMKFAHLHQRKAYNIKKISMHVKAWTIIQPHRDRPHALHALMIFGWSYLPSWFSSAEFFLREPPRPLHLQKHRNREKTTPEGQIHKSNTQRVWLPLSWREIVFRITMILGYQRLGFK